MIQNHKKLKSYEGNKIFLWKIREKIISRYLCRHLTRYLGRYLWVIKYLGRHKVGGYVLKK